MTQNFLDDLFNLQIDSEQIIYDYLNISSDKLSSEKLNYLKFALNDLRDSLNNYYEKKDIEIVNYKKIPPEFQNLSFNDNYEVFGVLSKSQLITYLILYDNRIMSFSFMNKGNIRIPIYLN